MTYPHLTHAARAPRGATLFATVALAGLLAGCTSGGADPPSAPDDSLLPVPAVGEGVQYSMTATIEAGREVELCRFVRAPAEGLWINRDQVRYTAGSHHFLVYETTYDAIPSEKLDGTAVDTSGNFDCSDGATNGWSIKRLVGGSQNASGDSGVRFPENVAMRVEPNAVLMMNAHYLNTQPEALEADIAINFWTIPEAQVEHEGDLLFWYNIFIEVPEMGSSEARMRCVVPEDITMTTMQSHMHARGTGYHAQQIGADMPFYMNDRWEDVPVTNYPDGFPIEAGATIEYACQYQNAEARDVYQGPSSSDEMCMLIGAYYPAVPGLSFCASDAERPLLTQGLGAEWVGHGKASCADTLECVQAGGEGEDFFRDLQGCVAASDPAASREVSDAVRCLLTSFADGEDPTSNCLPEIGVCLAS